MADPDLAWKNNFRLKPNSLRLLSSENIRYLLPCVQESGYFVIFAFYCNSAWDIITNEYENKIRIFYVSQLKITADFY